MKFGLHVPNSLMRMQPHPFLCMLSMLLLGNSNYSADRVALEHLTSLLFGPLEKRLANP